eukprot:2017155-Prymnesium_polylepis.1
MPDSATQRVQTLARCAHTLRPWRAQTMPTELTVEDVEGMKVAEMREALSERGLSNKGIKKELAVRLVEALQG